ncbi:MAG: hypothetical protein WKF75_17585 [Singulisphaera sp.]
MAGFHARGTYEGWRDAVKVAEGLIYPRAGLALYASLTPPCCRSSAWRTSPSTTPGRRARVRRRPSGSPPRLGQSRREEPWAAALDLGLVAGLDRASVVDPQQPAAHPGRHQEGQGADVAQTLYDVTSGRGRAVARSRTRRWGPGPRC